MLRDLKARWIGTPRLLVADGNPAIWAATRQVWPEARQQRWWDHKTRNVLGRLGQPEQAGAKEPLREVAYAPSRAEAVNARQAFSKRYNPGYPTAVDVLEDDRDRMAAFYDFPEPHWKLLTVAEKRFRRLTHHTCSATCTKVGSSWTESPPRHSSERSPTDSLTHPRPDLPAGVRRGTRRLTGSRRPRSGMIAVRHTSEAPTALLDKVVATQPNGREIHTIRNDLSAHHAKAVKAWLVSAAPSRSVVQPPTTPGSTRSRSGSPRSSTISSSVASPCRPQT